MNTATRIVEIIQSRINQPHVASVVAFWYECIDGREQFAEAVRIVASGLPLAPLILRGGFENPNSLMTDLRRLLTENQVAFMPPLFPMPPYACPVIILLLSRAPLKVQQISSPTTLPDWFPVAGGRTVSILIEDLIWTATGTLNSPECRMEEICEGLFELDRLLVARLAVARERDPNLGAGFFDCVKVEPKADKKATGVAVTEKYSEFLNSAADYLNNEIRNASGFRPSARDGKSVVGRLMRLASKSSPDELTSRATALARALDLKQSIVPPDDALITILLRSTTPVTDPAVLFARNLIATVYSASQMVTAASHSDAYPEYSLILLQGMSLNLRSSLNALCDGLVSC